MTQTPSPTPFNATATQASLEAFSKTQAELMGTKAPLDAERLRLLGLPNSQKTDAIKARIADLDKQIATINTQLDDNSKAQSTALGTTPEKLAAAQTKQALLKTVLEKVGTPPPGMLSLIQPSAAVKSADLMTYMTLTQHLNPYGRKRQCDTDLENLMSILNKELLNSLGDSKVLSQAITSLVKSVL